MGASGTKQGESGVPAKQGLLESDQIFEETIDTKTIKRQEKDNHQSFCDMCFIDRLMSVIAVYMCVVCEKYFCKKCFKGHNKRNKSHTVIQVKSKSGKNDGFDEFVSSMMNESELERKGSLRKTNVCVCDFVDTKHGLDKNEKSVMNEITGLTGYANKWWVACASYKYCMQVFSLGSNVLHRYIRLGSIPWDVTEIIVNEPDRKHLLAVTFPQERFILIIDLGKNPAVIHSKIKTEKHCESIDFYNGNLYTVCTSDHSPYPPHSVSILSVEGITLKTFQTDIPWSWPYPRFNVLNGNIYMPDDRKHRVVCYNDEGRVLHEIRIDGSRPRCICVDRSEDKVYVSSPEHDKVYELESDLSRYKPVFDQTARDMKNSKAICFFSDKLYVGHYSKSRSHVTVVRLL